MNVLVTGVTGLIGSELAIALRARGDSVVGVSRNPTHDQISWDSLTPSLLSEIDAVVNLAGESIAGRWTRSKKDRILSSRVEATSLVAAAIRDCDAPPACLVQASASGFYGDMGLSLIHI